MHSPAFGYLSHSGCSWQDVRFIYNNNLYVYLLSCKKRILNWHCFVTKLTELHRTNWSILCSTHTRLFRIVYNLQTWKVCSCLLRLSITFKFTDKFSSVISVKAEYSSTKGLHRFLLFCAYACLYRIPICISQICWTIHIWVRPFFHASLSRPGLHKVYSQVPLSWPRRVVNDNTVIFKFVVFIEVSIT